jgi:hypothetical protein
MTGILAANAALLLLKVIDLGIAAVQGSQRAREEQMKIRAEIDRQIVSGEGISQKFIDDQTTRIEALERRLFADPEDLTGPA